MMRFLGAALTVALLLLPSLPAAAAEKLTVLLDWFVNPDHGPLYVALEKGYFREAGLEVELIAPADPNDPPRLVAAGKGDIAISYQPQLHLQAEAGLPLARFGTLVATPLTTLIVRGDGPVQTIADLKGRKVGFSVGGFEDAILGTMLATHGLSLTDVILVNVNFALSPALMSGQVDATIGGYRNFELNQMAIEKIPARAWYPEEEGVPAYDELIFVAAKDRLSDPRLVRFLDAVERGTLFLVNHPDAAWELFIKGRPDLDTELNRRAWTDTVPRFAHSPAALDARRYERFATFLKYKGLITMVPPLESYAVQLR
ncbi:MAG: hypothetical protein RLY86_1838 [Pseudomonadota bacterium]|jgi:putative hydroxymethylpyrimidine transport system substrate-binding protein